MLDTKPSTTMRELGIVQAGNIMLEQSARAFDLPTEANTANTVVDDLFVAMDRVARVHPFAKGLGIAAPQIGIDRCVAVVRPAGPDAAPIVLFNPRIVAESDESDEQSGNRPASSVRRATSCSRPTIVHSSSNSSTRRRRMPMI